MVKWNALADSIYNKNVSCCSKGYSIFLRIYMQHQQVASSSFRDSKRGSGFEHTVCNWFSRRFSVITDHCAVVVSVFSFCDLDIANGRATSWTYIYVRLNTMNKCGHNVMRSNGAEHQLSAGLICLTTCEFHCCFSAANNIHVHQPQRFVLFLTQIQNIHAFTVHMTLRVCLFRWRWRTCSVCVSSLLCTQFYANMFHGARVIFDVVHVGGVRKTARCLVSIDW